MSLSLDGVSKAFGPSRAVDGVSLAVERGELFAVLGPSGSGKTTLLRLIAGFECPDAGSVTVGDRLVSSPSAFVGPERRRIGMVFQDYALFPHLTVRRNVAFGLPRANRERATSTLELVGLQHKADRYPHELSGGERQRVALARALAPGPEVVLLDEPFSSLDAALRADIRRDVELILREAETTAVLVTHDQEEALSVADRLAVMREGRVVQVGVPEDVYARPADRWAAQFVGEVNVVPGLSRGGGVETRLGTFDVAGGAGGAGAASSGVTGSAAAGSGAVHVAVRPEQLDLRTDRGSNAEITQREFRGHDVLYRLRHETGGAVLVQLPSVELFEVGDRVFVAPKPAAVVSLVD